MGRKVSELGEFGLIELLTAEIKNRDRNILRDFGDDTAFVRFGEEILLLTVDTLVEGTHFLSFFPPYDLGWKMVSVNVSDVAAKGGTPLYGLITVSAPPDLEVEFLTKFYKGMSKALNFYRFSLVGGNTTSSEKLCFDLSLVGKAKRVIYRDTPKVGDYIYVSGTLGDSRAGLELLLERKKDYKPYERKLIERHLRPLARLDLSPVVESYANASTDISDGFLSDLFRLAKNKRIVLFLENIPISEELKIYCSERGKNPLEYALAGGEDYQLLVSSKKDLTKYGFYKVGFVSEEGKGEIYDKRGEKIEPKGFEHFKPLR